MSTVEKVGYFLTMLTLYVVILITATGITSTTLELVAIAISFVEAVHWYYGLRHKRIGMYVWGLLVVIATVFLLLKASGI